MTLTKTEGRTIALIMIALCIVTLFLMTVSAAEGARSEAATCLECHGNKGFSTKAENGVTLDLFVDAGALEGSAHSFLDCPNCHAGYSSTNHPKPTIKTRRSFTESAARVCTSCHSFDKGIHKVMNDNVKKLVCVDCHGAHGVKKSSEGATFCLGCHSYGMPYEFGDGETKILQMDPSALEESVHKGLRCNDCHFGFSYKEHPMRKFKSPRDMTVVSVEGCRRCHFDKYTKTLESIHYNILTKGNINAPVCVDCHGAHSISSGRREKILSARRCKKCHSDIYDKYVKSVHGQALVSEHNQDVPVCSDCHRAHDIEDPRRVDFRNEIPRLCGNCHADKKLMSKYGISTDVLQSYLQDFHGITLTYYKKQENGGKHIAVCTDCHGIHGITSTRGKSEAVFKQNLLERCKKCHPGATKNFPDAWLSHYEPTFKRAPLVYLVNLVYKIFIPFMIVGLVLQILLHIWRYTVNR